MAEHDKDQKTEEATAKQQRKFRERGQVAKSQDLASVVTITTGTAAMVAAWPNISSSIVTLATGLLGRLDAHGKGALVGLFAGKAIIGIVAPVAIPVMIMGIAAQLAQVGWAPSLKSMEPNFSKMNPFPKLRQLFFSGSTIIELLKSLVKVVVIGSLAVGVLTEELVDNGRLTGLAPAELISRLGTLALRIVIRVGIALACIAVIDLLIERYRHKDKMKMTKEQVKQERKDSEGDPVSRSRLRQKQRDVARGRMLESVATADVLVVNPTHYSAAIRYRMATDAAPVIVALGTGEMAARIRERARKSGVPVVSDPPLARALYSKGKTGSYIPADLYKAVAALLAWVYNVTGKVAQ